MPYVKRRRYRRRKTYRKKRFARKKKSFMSRLRNKKLDTLYEKRAKQIAVKVVQAKVSKLIQRETWLRQPTFNQDGTLQVAGATWPEDDTWPLPLDMMRMGNNDFLTFPIMRCGGYFSSDIAEEFIQDPNFFRLRDLYVRLHAFRLSFDVANPGVQTESIDIDVWRVPFNKYATARDGISAQAQNQRENPIPERRWLKPLTTFNSLTSECSRAYTAQVPITKIGVTHFLVWRAQIFGFRCLTYVF